MSKERLTSRSYCDGFEDVMLNKGVTVGEAVCQLSDYEKSGMSPEECLELANLAEKLPVPEGCDERDLCSRIRAVLEKETKDVSFAPNGKVRFISYDGAYPNLCSGTLVMEIDGKEHLFGYHKGCNHRSFWTSGGCVEFDKDCSEIVTEGEWECSKDALPADLQPYADEIFAEFKANVPNGCCGGCV